jgi:hypothetical protein
MSAHEEEDYIKKTKILALVMQNGTLVDFETTGIPGKTKTCEVVTMGYLSSNKAVIVQRKSRDKRPFYAEIIKTIDGLPKPFFAYNASFERDIMKSELGLPVANRDFVDLMSGWRAKAEDKGTKWPGVSDLMSEPEDYFEELKITGASVPVLWDLYATQGFAVELLELIAGHCLSDILREAVLLLRYPEHAQPLPRGRI